MDDIGDAVDRIVWDYANPGMTLESGKKLSATIVALIVNSEPG